ncbi:MAG: 3-ketoacyl-CoA thiolase [Candidatus Fermentimicrarchaeum limneticum]|uniref:3-ketoacyl-CoA thiolase n=1 Tax=Fermentimicrarchaeum limneticum TaxID=2795018 RepID=A0A7D5XH01_FERL1|nr:MAG: 3-ketoacyl-CoA thiolase [Candidatus Fermentimicrarchaeum limneticum]
MRRVAIVGAAMTKFGEEWERGFRDMIAEAGVKAIDDANMSGKEIDAIYGGTMAAGRLIGQEHITALIADYMGLNPIPATRVEAACASGGVALRTGYLAVASGLHSNVVVGGVEKMTDVPVGEAAVALGGAGDQEWELFMGATFPALYAFMARRHMHEFGTTEEQMAMVAVKNHANASKNPYAHFQNQITLRDVMKSKKVADPLKLYDCSPITDGAAAIILAPLDKAREYTDVPVEIVASSQASDTLALHHRKSLTTLNATVVAARNAYGMAKVKPNDIDVCEVHDCFTIAEIIAYEDLGFFKKGKGGKAIEDGETALDGRIPINTSGGLKGCGHPVGATGVKQAVEITWQLRGEAKERQVKGAEIGMTHNVGGSGATCVIHIMKRAD